MQDFRNLVIWQKAHALALAIYEVSSEFPPAERFGITSQLRRAAVSIPTNIAEGCGRGGDAEFANFLQIAMGSASEVEYLLLLSADLRLVKSADYERLNGQVTEIKRMLAGFIRRLREQS